MIMSYVHTSGLKIKPSGWWRNLTLPPQTIYTYINIILNSKSDYDSISCNIPFGPTTKETHPSQSWDFFAGSGDSSQPEIGEGCWSGRKRWEVLRLAARQCSTSSWGKSWFALYCCGYRWGLWVLVLWYPVPRDVKSLDNFVWIYFVSDHVV